MAIITNYDDYVKIIIEYTFLPKPVKKLKSNQKKFLLGPAEAFEKKRKACY
jgi:hypothetical protein